MEGSEKVKRASESQGKYLTFHQQRQRKLYPLTAAIESQVRADKARVEYLLFLDKFVTAVRRDECIHKSKLLENLLMFDAEIVQWQYHQAADETITRLFHQQLKGCSRLLMYISSILVCCKQLFL